MLRKTVPKILGCVSSFFQCSFKWSSQSYDYKKENIKIKTLFAFLFVPLNIFHQSASERVYQTKRRNLERKWRKNCFDFVMLSQTQSLLCDSTEPFCCVFHFGSNKIFGVGFAHKTNRYKHYVHETIFACSYQEKCC